MPRPLVNAAVVLLVLAALVTPMRRDLFVGDETKYGQVVREMRTTGAFFLPTLNGEPFTHKPPLHFWLIDLLTYPLGVYSTWAFVLPSLGAFVFLLWLMWRRGRPLAAFICGASTMIWASAQSARMDVAFTAFIALAAWQMERFFDRDDFRALLWSGVALGIATLIKGPMAPVIAIVLFLLEWRRRRHSPHGNYAPATAAMIVIPLLWFVPAMIVGGSAYTHEVIVKQTVGRAVASWVHNAPPWFYLLHMPGTLFPWFFLAAVAVVALWRTERFLINWILAVLLPYSVMSSKLDVYMMALIPPVALLIARYVENDDGRNRARWPNVVAVALIVLASAAALFVRRPELALPGVRPFLFFAAGVSIVALLIAVRGSLAASTLATGLLPVALMVYIGIALMPMVNEMTSTRPLVAALERQHVPADQIALYTTPYLWTRDMPPVLEHVRYVDAGALASTQPQVVATSRAHARELAGLQRYRVVDSVRMIGKWFDVYRR